MCSTAIDDSTCGGLPRWVLKTAYFDLKLFDIDFITAIVVTLISRLIRLLLE